MQGNLESLSQALMDEPDHDERVRHLEEAHRAIDKQLAEMSKHPHVEESNIAEMKKKKLQLKDQITELKTNDIKDTV